MANYNLTNQPISASFQQLLQVNESNYLVDGTGSLVDELNVTGSISASTYYGDGSNLTGISGGGGSIDTGSLLESASVSDATITFTKADGQTFDVTVDNVANATSASRADSALSADTATSATSATSASHAEHSDTTQEVIINVKNTSGGTLAIGTPVYATGVTGDNINVSPADYSSASTMPAIAVLQEELTNNASGEATVSGKIIGVNTSGFTAGRNIYVNGSGTFTDTKPTGSNLIQNIGVVGKVNATEGEIIIQGSGRSNDLPNIAEGYAWVGDSNGVPQAILTSSFEGGGGGTIDTGSFINTGSVEQTKNANIVQSITAPGTDEVKNFIVLDSAENNGLTYTNNTMGIQNYPSFGRSYQDTLLFEFYDSVSYNFGTELGLNGGQFQVSQTASGSGAGALFRIQDDGAAGTDVDLHGTAINIGTFSGTRLASSGITIGRSNVPVTVASNNFNVSGPMSISGQVDINGGAQVKQGEDLRMNDSNSSIYLESPDVSTLNINAIDNNQSINITAGNTGAGSFPSNITIASESPSGSVTLKGQEVKVSSSLDIESTLTASLSEGFVWMGDSNNRTILASTASLQAGAIDTGSFAIKEQSNTFTEGPQIASASDGNGYFNSKPTMPTSGFVQKALWEANGQGLSVDGNGNYGIYQETLSHFNGYGRWYDGVWYQEFLAGDYSYGTEVTANGGGWKVGVTASGSGGSNGRVYIEDNWDNTTNFKVDAQDIQIGTSGGSFNPQNITIGKINTPLNLNSSNAITVSGSIDIEGNLTSSLQEGYVWVGDFYGRTTAVSTGSLASIDTGSLLVTSSATNNVITFTKGDGSTYTNTIDTGSGGGGGAAFPYTGDAQITGSLGVSGSLVIQGNSYPDNRLGFKSGSTEYVSMYIDTGSEFVPDAWVINHHTAGQIVGVSNANGWLEVNTVANLNSSATFRGDTSFRNLNQESGYTSTLDKASVNTTLTLSPQNPLPSGAVGEMATSGSNLYFHNGTEWKEVSFV